MPSKKKDHKQSGKKKKPRVKLSQKVIQNVIVKIGEHKRAKKARRAKAQKKIIEEPQMIQAPIPANVIYQTGYDNFQKQQSQYIVPHTVHYTPPSSYEDLEKKSSKIVKNIGIQFEDVGGIGTHGTSEIIDKSSKEEILSQLQEPVSISEFAPNATFTSPAIENRTESPNSKLYTQQILPQENVAGNQTFGEPIIEESKSKRKKLPEDFEMIGPKPKKPNKSTIEKIMLALNLNEEEAINHYYTERANDKNSLQINKELDKIISDKIKQGKMSITKEKGGIRTIQTPSRIESFSHKLIEPQEETIVASSSVKFK